MGGQNGPGNYPALAGNLVTIHHVGSTAVAGISAKPIIDLMPAVGDLMLLDRSGGRIESLGYCWRGELGIARRRFCTLTDPSTGRRQVQAHCLPDGATDVEHHLAFRDYLRAHANVARS